MKEKAAVKRQKVVISDEFAAQLCVARVGDEVTHTLVKESGSAVLKDSEVCLIYEIAERILVLSNYL